MHRLLSRRLFLAAAFSFCMLSAAKGQAIQRSLLMDFGTTGVTAFDGTNTWNTVPASVAGTDTGVFPLNGGILATDTTDTGIKLQMVSRFNAENTNGTTGSTLFPGTATQDSFYGNTGVFNGLTNVFPRFKLTNLDITKAYNFTFYASRTGVGDVRETGYTVSGGISGFAALNVANNINNVAQVFGITPNSSGEILISLDPTANNTNSPTFFTYLGVMRLDVVPEPSSALAIVSGVGMLGVIRRRRK